MFGLLKRLIWNSFVKIDSILKYPNLKKGDIGIQLGFDMNAPVTTDIFSMYNRVKSSGIVLAIDANPDNILRAEKVIKEKKLNIQLIHKAVSFEKGRVQLMQGENPSWNQLNNIPLDSSVKFLNTRLEVGMDSLDNIIKELNIDIQKIRHINLTINGSEYNALLGMTNILALSPDLAVTVVAGRYDETGTINGRPDNEVISELLHQYGFKTRFKRIHQLFWWGFIAKTLLNRKWIYGKKNYGVIMAVKGHKGIPRYQSFS
jgi:FkbM family methyltransferase